MAAAPLSSLSSSKIFNPPFVKSNYNLGSCEGCGKVIKHGDSITKVMESANTRSSGMELRYRLHVDGSFYQPYTGSRFVHIDCTIEDEYSAYWTLYNAYIASKKVGN